MYHYYYIQWSTYLSTPKRSTLKTLKFALRGGVAERLSIITTVYIRSPRRGHTEKSAAYFGKRSPLRLTSSRARPKSSLAKPSRPRPPSAAKLVEFMCPCTSSMLGLWCGPGLWGWVAGAVPGAGLVLWLLISGLLVVYWWFTSGLPSGLPSGLLSF